MIFRAVADNGCASARRTSSSTPASNIARVRASIRASSSSAGTSRPTISVGSRVSTAQSAVAAERVAGFGELERADDPAAVVRVHRGRRLGIALGEERVRRLGALLVVDALPALARARLRRRRNVQLGERRAEVQAGAADDDRRPAGGERSVDRLVRERLVLGDRRLVVELPDPDEAPAGDWLVRIGTPR